MEISSGAGPDGGRSLFVSLAPAAERSQSVEEANVCSVLVNIAQVLRCLSLVFATCAGEQDLRDQNSEAIRTAAANIATLEARLWSTTQQMPICTVEEGFGNSSVWFPKASSGFKDLVQLKHTLSRNTVGYENGGCLGKLLPLAPLATDCEFLLSTTVVSVNLTNLLYSRGSVEILGGTDELRPNSIHQTEPTWACIGWQTGR